MSIFKNDIFTGKVAFVTGGGSGICYGITKELMAHGARAAILGRKEERLCKAAKALSTETGQICIATPGDVREPEKIEAALQATLDEFGRIDIVVNGAAGNFLAPAASLSYNGFKTVIAIDTLGTYNVSKAAFDKYLKHNGGHILNISATLHYGATPLQTHAAAAKAAVDSITRSLALEWGSLGIQVNGIAPGPIADTEGMMRLAPPKQKEAMIRGIPLRRFGTVKDIANAAVFLCSEAGSYVHGETLVVDGGSCIPSGMAPGFALNFK